MSYSYKYPRPALTVDCIIFQRNNKESRLLLIQRKHEPFAGKWAFPGGFVDMNETTETAAKRELEEETGLKNVELKQFYTFSDVHRDPRGRTVTVVYFGFADSDNCTLEAKDDAAKASWFNINNLPPLAFDHEMIIEKLLHKLKIE